MSETFQDALDFLYRQTNYETFQTIPYEKMTQNLLKLRRFLEYLGNPQNRFRVVHVAGTKGKGSVCMTLDQILRRGKYRTGLFTSPHLRSITERISIDGVPCDENDFARTLFRLKNVWERFLFESGMTDSGESTLTFFEWSVLIAYEMFAEKKIDVAVVETGLGGRFDATNVGRSDVSVITSVSFDHQEQLGSTLLQIAGEKAGIIKEKTPVVSGVLFPVVCGQISKRDSSETNSDAGGRDWNPATVLAADQIVAVQRLIRETAERLDAPFYSIEAISDFVRSISLPVLGEHQRWNAEIAIQTLAVLESTSPTPETTSTLKKIVVSPDDIRIALERLKLPGRIEILSTRPLFVIDGAHNRASVVALAQALEEKYPDYQKTLLFATTIGKDVSGMIAELFPRFDRVVLTEYGTSPRALSLADLTAEVEKFRRFCVDSGKRLPRIETEPNLFSTLESVFSTASDPFSMDDSSKKTTKRLFCATGSFYFIAKIQNFFQSEFGK